METIGLISSLLLMTFVLNSVTCKILTQSFVIRLKEIAQVMEDQKQVIEDQEEIIENLNITQESMKEQVEELNNTQESMKEQVEKLNTTVMEHDSCLTEQSNRMAAINTTLMTVNTGKPYCSFGTKLHRSFTQESHST